MNTRRVFHFLNTFLIHVLFSSTDNANLNCKHFFFQFVNTIDVVCLKKTSVWKMSKHFSLQFSEYPITNTPSVLLKERFLLLNTSNFTILWGNFVNIIMPPVTKTPVYKMFNAIPWQSISTRLQTRLPFCTRSGSCNCIHPLAQV